MTKIAIVSDFHLGIRKNSDIMFDSQKRFFNNLFYPYLRKNNIKDIIVLGDIFDRRDMINVKILNEAYDLFDNEFNYTVLIGNHDSYLNTSNKITSLKFLKKFNNVTVIDTIQESQIAGYKFLLVPWIFDNEKFIEDLKQYNSNICFGHFDVNGFSMGNKMSDALLMPEVFDKFNKVFSGHFHTPQSKKFGNTEFVYCGSICQTDWGEVGQSKGFYILDTDSLEYEFIENTVSAKHIKVTYGDPINSSDISNNYIKIFIKESETEDEKKYDEFIEKITELSPASLSTMIVKEDEDLDTELEIFEKGQTLLELISEFIGLQDTIDNKEEIKNLLENIYTESLKE